MSHCQAQPEQPHTHFCFDCRVTFSGDVYKCPVCNRPERKPIYNGEPLTSQAEIEAKRTALPMNQNFDSPFFLMTGDALERALGL